MTFNTVYTSLQPVAYALDRDVPEDDEGDDDERTVRPRLGMVRHSRLTCFSSFIFTTTKNCDFCSHSFSARDDMTIF